MITKFEQWKKVTELRNQILDLDSEQTVENLIITVIRNFKIEGASDKDVSDFVGHLNTLFLTYLVTEGQDHSQTNSNVKKAREILKKIETDYINKKK